MKTLQSNLEDVIKSTLGAQIVLIEVSWHEYIAAMRQDNLGEDLYRLSMQAGPFDVLRSAVYSSGVINFNGIELRILKPDAGLISRYHVAQEIGGSQPFYISLYPVHTSAYLSVAAAEGVTVSSPTIDERVAALEREVAELKKMIRK
jgi:hypothetical protein